MIRPGRHPFAPTTGAASRAAWLLALVLPVFCAFLAGPAARAEEAPAAGDEDEAGQENPPADSGERGEEAGKPAPPRKTAPGRREGPVARDAPAAKDSPASGAAPLRFTDEDLEKFHKPIPPEEIDAEAAAEPEAAGGTAPAAPGQPAPGPPANPNRPRRLLTKPRPRQPPPPPDPLKSFKDRDAMEKFRAEQIQTLRDRVREMEGRLGYLNAKRDALLNPAPLQAGRTQAADGPNPYRPGDPFRGAGKTPIGGFFPPIPPAQTDEDKQKDKTLKIKDLIADVEKEVEAVEADLEEAREDLVSAELRFGTGAGIP